MPDNSPTLYIVRHGETDWNAAARYQGQRDIPLNDRGRLQARRNGEVLGEALGGRKSALAFVASPLQRTRETMDILRDAMGLPQAGYALDERLREVHYGHWEGQLLSDLPRTDAEGIAARRSDPFNWCPRDGESYADLTRRVAGWLEHIVTDTVVVTHGGVSRVLRGLRLGIDPHSVPYLEVPQDRVLILTGDAQRWL